MKKTLLLICLLICTLCVFADVKLQKYYTSSSLYQENPVDPYGFNSEIKLVYLPVKAETDIKFVTYYAENADSDLKTAALSRFGSVENAKPLYISGKSSINKSFFVTDFILKNNHKLTMDLNVKGYLSAVFEATGGADMLAFDGSYFVGPEVALDDKLVFRAGIHHLSGHYGDEVLDEFKEHYFITAGEENKDRKITINGDTSLFYGMAQYVRDNEMLLGLQYNLPAGFSCYFEYAQPFKKSFVRPFFECPKGHKLSTYDGDAWVKLSYGEGVDSNPDDPTASRHAKQIMAEEAKYDKWYVAARIHTGVTWSKTWNKTEVFAGLDFQAHQDGQTLHTLGGYNKNNSWEYELTVGTGVFYKENNNHGIGFKVEYHKGRFPALNLFANRVNALYVGAIIK